MIFLRNKGIEEEIAYLITQQVSKGKRRYDHKKDIRVIWKCCKSLASQNGLYGHVVK